MLYDLEDLCRWIYPQAGDGSFHRLYYQLFRFTRNAYRRGCYCQWSIPKKTGGERRIAAPCDALKRIQRALLPLLTAQDLPQATCAYVQGRNLLDSAAPHAGQPLVMRVDIEDFFGSLRFPQVFAAVDRALRCSPLVGRHHLNAFDRCERDGRHYNQVLSFFIARLCTLDGALPQGAPTSPALSNLVFAPLDRRIAAYCSKRDIAYTRYSDDLSFSGAFRPQALLSSLRRLLAENGLRLNDGKTVIAGRGMAQRVTGLGVNVRPQPPAGYRRALRQEMYYIGKYGVRDHLSRIRYGEDPAAYLRRLLGRIGFVLPFVKGKAREEFCRYRDVCGALLSQESENTIQ